MSGSGTDYGSAKESSGEGTCCPNAPSTLTASLEWPEGIVPAICGCPHGDVDLTYNAEIDRWTSWFSPASCTCGEYPGGESVPEYHMQVYCESGVWFCIAYPPSAGGFPVAANEGSTCDPLELHFDVSIAWGVNSGAHVIVTE